MLLNNCYEMTDYNLYFYNCFILGLYTRGSNRMSIITGNKKQTITYIAELLSVDKFFLLKNYKNPEN